MWVLVTTILYISGVKAERELPVNFAEVLDTLEECEMHREAIKLIYNKDKKNGKAEGVTFEETRDWNYRGVSIVKTKETHTYYRCLQSGEENYYHQNTTK